MPSVMVGLALLCDPVLIDLLLATNAPKQLLAITVPRKADTRTVPLDLQPMPALPALQVQAFNAHLFLERLSLFVNKLVLFVRFRTLVVASAILGTVSSEDFDRNTDDKSKPKDGDELEKHQRNQERILDTLGIADMASWVVERFNKMCPAGRGVDRPDEIGAVALPAARRHNLRGVGPDRPTDHEIGDVAEQDPGD